MITTTDTANIIYTACKAFGMPVYQGGNVPDSLVGADGRIVIHAKEQSSERIWKKNYIEVNFFIPDTPQGKADLIRLNEIERTVAKTLKGNGQWDGTAYRYETASISVSGNETLKSHYVNARLLFKCLNTTE